MSLTGNLRTMPISDIFQWLQVARKSGTLVVEGKRFTKRMYFVGGKLVAVASDRPQEMLGRYLVGWGYLSSDELDYLVEMQEHFKVMVGELAVSLGQIARSDLERVIRVKTQEAICDLLLWDDGDFRFLDGELPDRDFVELEIPVESILLEGARQRDERGRIARLIPDERHRPRLVQEPAGADFGEGEQQILRAVDGSRTIGEIALRSRVAVFNVLKLVYRCVKAGWMELAEPEPAAEEVAGAAAPREWEALAEEVRDRVGRNRLFEALQSLDALRDAHGADAEAAEAANELEVEIVAGLSRSEVVDDAVLEPSITVEELMKLGCAPVEGFAFSRVNGSYKVAEILGLLPVDARHGRAILHNLVRRNLVKVADARAVQQYEAPRPGLTDDA